MGPPSQSAADTRPVRDRRDRSTAHQLRGLLRRFQAASPVRTQKTRSSVIGGKQLRADDSHPLRRTPAPELDTDDGCGLTVRRYPTVITPPRPFRASRVNVAEVPPSSARAPNAAIRKQRLSRSRAPGAPRLGTNDHVKRWARCVTYCSTPPSPLSAATPAGRPPVRTLGLRQHSRADDGEQCERPRVGT